MQVGQTLYICTPQNKVFALDAETGKEIWRFDAKPDLSGGWFQCRGLGYWDASLDLSGAGSDNAPKTPGTEATAAASQCATRIVMSTVDARLLQLDARTGELCREFGDKGVVNLMTGMGNFPVGFYVPTSAPTVVRGRIVIGGAVPDNVDINVPSGVVRAFDARTGALVWVWDMGQPELTLPLPEGHVFTKGTPNFWSHAAFDEELGLIYLPTGNSSPDRWGGKATIAEAMNRDPRTIQRHIEKMEKQGYIERKRRFVPGFGSRPNVYDLDGLIRAAQPYADEKVKELAKKKAAREAAIGRKGKARVEDVDAFS